VGELDHVADPSTNGSEPERRFALDFARASSLAMMVAQSRADKQVQLADLLAGMYIYEWSRLSRFWEHREPIEDFLRGICSISPQRWHRWIELYDERRRAQDATEMSTLERLLAWFRRKPAEGGEDRDALPFSREVESVLDAAAQISPSHDEVDGRRVPVLTTECVLLSMARKEGSEIARRLQETGLDIIALERRARDPRHAPRRRSQ
jgi:hypothetical protein